MYFAITRIFLILVLSLGLFCQLAYASNHSQRAKIKTVVDQTIKPLIKKYKIPGAAIAVTLNNKDYFFNYGVASITTKKPITQHTLFAIGTVTKTFTATLATYLQKTHQLKLTNLVATYLPKLKSSALANVSLINLATHTSELPLSLPKRIKSKTALLRFLRRWKPKHKIGSQRMYSNLGVGLLGLVITKATGEAYATLLTQDILKPLGLNHTYFKVPKSELVNEAQGYTRKNNPMKRSTQSLLPAAYGLKSSSQDLIRFLQANMRELKYPSTLARAIQATHAGYYKTRFMTQDLVWEQYELPLSLNTLLKGHENELSTEAALLQPILAPQQNVYIDESGTGRHRGGFMAYVAFIPAKHLGIVILANKAYPPIERSTVGYILMTKLLQVSD